MSDSQAEEQLDDRLSFQKFVGLRSDEASPDETVDRAGHLSKSIPFNPSFRIVPRAQFCRVSG
jgi:IS5 family transposase